ncbi:hypothetical protein MRX96_022604 [Rhipicephalus microplus]
MCRQPAPTDEPEEEFRQEFCFMPHEAGPCTNMEVRWFYDKQDGVCREFYYGGCLGNRNRFRSRRDCEERCFSSQDVCTLPKVQGPCSGTFIQWFYDTETDRCHEFTYGGCQGNANRFNDREACEKKCRKGAPLPVERPTPPDVCTLPKQPGPCYGLLMMWYFDTATRECRNFTYGGCEGNDNRFESLELCKQRCAHIVAPAVVDTPARRPTKPWPSVKGACKRMADKGDCSEVHARWFYDVKTGNCLPFVYTGCGGNRNRFKSHEICMKVCSGVTMDTPDYEVDEPGTNEKRMPPPPSRGHTRPDQELEPRAKPPMPVTPFPEPFPLTPAAPPQTPAPECLPSNCEELQCPLGKNQTVDHRGCVQCRCSNPCETFSCHEAELCRIEAYRSPDGRPNYRPVCRLVNKAGHCPVAEVEAQPAAVVRADCRDVCRVDADCPDIRKCCYNGCAHVCVQAVVTEVTTVQTSTTTQAPILTVEPTTEELAAPAKPEVTANAGSDVTLSCLERPFLIVSVEWTFRDELVESNEGRFKILVDGSLHISQLTGDDAGPYRCTADDGHQKVSHVTNLVVYVPATIRPSSATVTVTVSETARMACLAVGYPRPVVQWYRNSKQLPQRSSRYAQLDDFTLAVRNVTQEDEGIYMCRAYNYHGQPAVWKLDCYVTGAPEPRVSWLHEGKQVETDGHRVLMENHTLYIPSAAMSDGGEYSCQADNGHSNQSVSVHIVMDDIHVPESCTDSPRFANCNLIVRARYCTNKHYSSSVALHLMPTWGNENPGESPNRHKVERKLCRPPPGVDLAKWEPS